MKIGTILLAALLVWIGVMLLMGILSVTIALIKTLLPFVVFAGVVYLIWTLFQKD
jgi:hypothetical protein